MNRIISFLMDNIVIVVIVVGLIYSMFFRKSTLEKRPPGRMPDFGGGPLTPQWPRRPGAPAGSPQSQPNRPPVERGNPVPDYRETPAAQPAEDRPLEHREPVYRLPAPAGARTATGEMPDADRVLTAPAPSRAPTATAAPARAVARTPENAESSLSRDDLTRAVMWAEILGPPRSRRPFRR